MSCDLNPSGFPNVDLFPVLKSGQECAQCGAMYDSGYDSSYVYMYTSCIYFDLVISENYNRMDS